MLSRRNVRIKVMQMLYSMSRDSELGVNDVVNRYRASIQKSFELYLFCLLSLIRITGYAKQDAAKKMAKLLPTEEDKQFTAKLGDNALMKSLVINEGLQQLFRKYKLNPRFDTDQVRFFYTDFAKTDEYRDYVMQDSDDPESHREILLALYKHLLSLETYDDFIEDHFSNWIDDKSLVAGAIKKTIKGLPATEDFYEEYRPTAETTEEFGEKLLRKACEEDTELLSIIEPTLRNWDADRVAVIDMILLKMALCELMSFPTIPTKVTLNEFVEISKLYSTDKSKDFINGILDRLMKQLNKDGKIEKKGRGLQE
ncbi:MAG: transcription antitermination factor NusB [Phaeodactylibacter sp.]|nr:transcription antitermination factor NusB [Phaeodactylibacter sp.]MCB9297637.1 transcription antitermination factor NusB [Lewinellaceae bacterium]